MPEPDPEREPEPDDFREPVPDPTPLRGPDFGLDLGPAFAGRAEPAPLRPFGRPADDAPRGAMSFLLSTVLVCLVLSRVVLCRVVLSLGVVALHECDGPTGDALDAAERTEALGTTTLDGDGCAGRLAEPVLHLVAVR